MKITVASLIGIGGLKDGVYPFIAVSGKAELPPEIAAYTSSATINVVLTAAEARGIEIGSVLEVSTRLAPVYGKLPMASGRIPLGAAVPSWERDARAGASAQPVVEDGAPSLSDPNALPDASSGVDEVLI